MGGKWRAQRLAVRQAQVLCMAAGRSDKSLPLRVEHLLAVFLRGSSPDEAEEICPLLAGEDILAASYCATDAHATPESVVQGYAIGAREHGAPSRWHAGRGHRGRATAITACGPPTGRRDRHGDLRRGGLVARLRELAGVPLDVTPMRRQVLFTAPMARPAAQAPADDRFRNRLLLPPRGPRPADRDGRPGRDARPSARAHRGVDPRRCCRSPRGGRRASPPRRSRAAGPVLYDMSPDYNAMIGEARRSRASCTRPGSPATVSCRARRPARSCATSCSGARRCRRRRR